MVGAANHRMSMVLPCRRRPQVEGLLVEVLGGSPAKMASDVGTGADRGSTATDAGAAPARHYNTGTTAIVAPTSDYSGAAIAAGAAATAAAEIEGLQQYVVLLAAHDMLLDEPVHLVSALGLPPIQVDGNSSARSFGTLLDLSWNSLSSHFRGHATTVPLN